jgi:hypothetical protein
MNIYTVDPLSQKMALQYKVKGSQGDMWNGGQIDIMSAIEYQIYIEGVVGANYTSDIAIDDTEMLSGTCYRKY